MFSVLLEDRGPFLFYWMIGLKLNIAKKPMMRKSTSYENV